MTYASLFSGVGGWDYGFDRAGFASIWACEIDKQCQSVLRRHWPKTKIYDDVTTLKASELECPDVLLCSPPCQAFSVAGLRQSLNDDRGNLSLVTANLINELDPRLVCIENVPGWLSTKDNAFGCFLAALVGADAPLVPPKSVRRWRTVKEYPDCDADGDRCQPDAGGKRHCGGQHRCVEGEAFSWTDAGMVAGPKRHAAWRVLSSEFFGLAQSRYRVFVVADTVGGCCGQILFEQDGVRRNFAPSRETRENIAPCLSNRAKGGGGFGTGAECSGALISETAKSLCCGNGHAFSSDKTYVPEIACSLNAQRDGCNDGSDQTYVPEVARKLDSGSGGFNSHSEFIPEIAACLQERDSKGSDSSTKPGHLIPEQNQAYSVRLAQTSSNGIGVQGEKTHTLDGAALGVAYRTSGNCGAFEQGDKTSALNTATDPNQNVVCEPTAYHRNASCAVTEQEGGVTAALKSNGEHSYQFIHQNWRVRHLHPVECARLSGFPDSWCKSGIDANGKESELSDSFQYRAYGNCVNVPVARWIAERIAKHSK